MEGEILLRTSRFDLRRVRVSDLEACHSYMGREDVATYQMWDAMSRDDVLHRLSQWAQQSYEPGKCEKFSFIVVDRASGQTLGDVGFKITDADARQAEVGYCIHPDWQGKGVATEAIRAVVGALFDRFDMHRVFARCDARNVGSWRVMEKLGMRREAHFREHALFKGGWDEEFYYAILEDEWREQA